MPEIFHAKSIVTMNAGQPRATHVLVSQGYVLSVGTEEDIALWQEKWPNTPINSVLADKVILPGFV
jgi:predicted amidohydrolase YtcJ